MKRMVAITFPVEIKKAMDEIDGKELKFVFNVQIRYDTPILGMTSNTPNLLFLNTKQPKLEK